MTDAGVETMMAPCWIARCAASSRFSSTTVRRSKAKVATVLRSGPERKTPRITCSVKRSRGAGTTCITSCVPSASMRARRGETVVVLPSPMSIWWHTEPPERAQRTSLSSRCTCGGRSTIPAQNSKTKIRGSSRAVGAGAPGVLAPGSCMCARRVEIIAPSWSPIACASAASASASGAGLPPRLASRTSAARESTSFLHSTIARESS